MWCQGTVSPSGLFWQCGQAASLAYWMILSPGFNSTSKVSRHFWHLNVHIPRSIALLSPPRVRAVEYARIRSKCQRELCNVRKTTNKVVYLLPSRDFCLLTFSRAFWISRISFSCFSESFWTVLIACDYFLTAALLPSAFGHDTISGLVSQVCC
jgi:hypothetical protein